MQSDFSVKCSAGKSGARVCGLHICQEMSIMCSDQQCQCRTHHKLCSTTPIKQIWKSLILKGQSHKPILLQCLQWYDIQIKRFQVQREQLQEQIDKIQPLLFGHQKQLFNHLKSGEAEKVKPELVFKVISLLRQSNQQTILKHLTQIKSFLEIKTIEINQILGRVRKQKNQYCKNLVFFDNVPLKFSQTLHNKSLEVINDQTIKKISNNGYWAIALIQPNISSNRQLKLQMVEVTSKYLLFGVCQIEDITKINQINHSNFEKGVLMSCNGPKSNYFGKSKGNERTKDQIEVIDNQDILSVKCLYETNTVIFENESKNTTTEFKIQIDKNIPLYFCVQLCYEGNSVKILN